jgi:hypothetical protein
MSGSAASFRATSSPMPLLAPVTTATLCLPPAAWARRVKPDAGTSRHGHANRHVRQRACVPRHICTRLPAICTASLQETRRKKIQPRTCTNGREARLLGAETAREGLCEQQSRGLAGRVSDASCFPASVASMGTKDPRADAERYLEKHNVRGLFKHLSTKVRHSRGAAAREASWHRIAPRCARLCLFSRPVAQVSPRPAPRPQRPAGFVREARGPQSFPRPGT